MADTSLIFNIIAKDSTAAGMNKATSGMDKFKRSAKIASAAVLAGGATIATQSVKLASTQAANYSKYEQVTKQAMDKSAETQARSLLLSRSDYADYFSQLSAMYQSNGIGVQDANKMAAESMKTAADAAAFGNTDVRQAVQAQLGLLKGSGELWEQYSVSIKASDVSERVKTEQIKSLTKEQQKQWKTLGELEPAERKVMKAKLEGQMVDKKALEATVKHNLAQEKAKLFLGQAAKESGSLESAQQRMKATMDDLGASLGTMLLPYVESFAAKLQKVAEWAEKNQTIIKIVGGVVLGLAAAVWIVNGAVKAWTATTAAFNAVMAMNPAVLVALAIIALIAVVVLIATKTTWFQQIWNKAWGAIKGAVSATLGWVRSNWPLLLAILTGPFGLAVLAITKNWDRIVSTVKGLPGRIKAALGGLLGTLKQHGMDLIQGFINGIVDKAASIPGAIKSKVVGVAKSALHGFGLFGSPSRLTMKYGRWWTEGFAIGMKDKSADVIAKAKDLIQGLKDKLAEVKDFAKQIRDAFVSSSNPTSLMTEEDNFASLLAKMRGQANAAREFAAGIATLRGRGLNETTLGQLRAGGVEQSMATLRALLSGDVGSVNAVASDIARTGQLFGNSEAKAVYGIDPSKSKAVRIELDLTGADDDLLKRLRKQIRVNGGNVQVVLGGKK